MQHKKTIQRLETRHNTYSFKHLECLQLQFFFLVGVPSFTSNIDLGRDFGDSGFLELEKKDNEIGKSNVDFTVTVYI